MSKQKPSALLLLQLAARAFDFWLKLGQLLVSLSLSLSLSLANTNNDVPPLMHIILKPLLEKTYS
jgi:hypothetical protein